MCWRESKAYAIDAAITTGGNSTAQGPCVYEEHSPTLKAGGVHAVCAAFLPRNSATSRSIGYEEDMCPTLSHTGQLPCVIHEDADG